VSGSTVPNSTIEVPVKLEFTNTWWREIDVTSRSATAGVVPRRSRSAAQQRRW
jgi:hypothetical protein